MPLRLLTLVLTLAYPFIIWWGLGAFGVSFLAILMVVISALRYANDPKPSWLVILTVSVILAGYCSFFKEPIALKLYPVLMNGMMLFMFGSSLFDKETIIERVARFRDPELPLEAVRYTRRLTQLWCLFFIANGSVAAWTAFGASDKIWAIYNGAIAYGLMGCMFAGEWLYRKLVLKL